MDVVLDGGECPASSSFPSMEKFEGKKARGLRQGARIANRKRLSRSFPAFFLHQPIVFYSGYVAS